MKSGVEMLDWKWYKGNLEWLKTGTIFLTRGGSHAYGTNLPSSDEDFRGVAVPPRQYFTGFVNVFEQMVQSDPDLTIFDIRKFFKLTADCNPNMIEMLFTDPSDWVMSSMVWENVIHQNRQAFLSQKALHTFSGYAMSQLKRIKTHRRWLLNPPAKKPERADFGLPNHSTLPKEQFGVIEAKVKKVEDSLGGQGFTKDRVEEVDEAMVTEAILSMDLSPNLIPIVIAERKYGAAMRDWTQFEQWEEGRNEVRAQLERKYGYDTKHGMHLVRLMRMATEILRDGQVLVKRPDAKELLEIRAGAWSFDDLMAWAYRMEEELLALKTSSKLPHGVDRKHLDGVCSGAVEIFLGFPYMSHALPR